MSDSEIKLRILGYHLEEGELVSASAAKEVISHFHSELAKANERVAELEQVNLELAAKVNAYDKLADMDMGAAIDRLFELDNAESAALLNKFAIEQQIKGVDAFINHFRYEFEGARDTDSIEAFADAFTEQLRKEQNSE